jgi:hypothetical protein
MTLRRYGSAYNVYTSCEEPAITPQGFPDIASLNPSLLMEIGFFSSGLANRSLQSPWRGAPAISLSEWCGFFKRTDRGILDLCHNRAPSYY